MRFHCRADLFMKKQIVITSIKWGIFIIYLMTLLYVVFFAKEMGRAEIASGYKYNIHPFMEIKRYIKYLNDDSVLGRISFLNIIGNVLVFIPFGFFMPWLTDKKSNFIITLIYGFALSLAIEFVQLICKVGCFDVDDLMLNSLGVVLGYIAFKVIFVLIGIASRRKGTEDEGI